MKLDDLNKEVKCIMKGKPAWVIGCTAVDEDKRMNSSFLFKENEWDMDKLISCLKFVYDEGIDADLLYKQLKRSEEELIYQKGPLKSVTFKHGRIDITINTMAGQLIDF